AATLVADAGSGDAAARSADGGAYDGPADGLEGSAPDGGVGDGGAPADAPPRGRVVGRVLAKGTRQPVAGAALTADVSDVGASDARGDFAVDVPCGPRRLTIQAPGFERVTTIVD